MRLALRHGLCACAAAVVAARAGASAPGCAAASRAPAAAAAPRGPGVPHRRPPALRAVPFFEVRHGALVADPYRWLEGAPPFERPAAAAVRDEGRYAARVLGAIGERDRWLAALELADHGDTPVAITAVTGPPGLDRYFLTMLPPDRDVAQLYVRDGARGADRLLVDPALADEPGERHALRAAVPSPDGRRVAYALEDHGDEHGAVAIVDVARGKDLADRVDAHGAFSWRADGEGLYYAWAHAVWLHPIGAPRARDQRVFGGAQVGVVGADLSVFDYRGSAWSIAIASPGVSAGAACFVAPAAQVPGGAAPWRQVAAPADDVVQILAHGDDVFALVGGGGPARRLVRFAARDGDVRGGVDVVAPGGDALVAMDAAADALYVQVQRGRARRLVRVPWRGGAAAELPLEAGASIGWFQARPDAPGVWFEVDRWTEPPAWRSYAPPQGAGASTGVVAELPLPRAAGGDPDVVADDVLAVSRDGTPVPLTILHRKDLAQDGAAAAILRGYGSYGISAAPGYDRIALAWVDRGGVWADCDTRGGGGWRTPRHLAGIGAHKEDAVDDYLACAQYLVDHGWTGAARLTASSYSSGGVLIGGAITKRPDLFAAAILESPVVELLRAQAMPSGRANVSEYGDVAVAADFAAMRASDPCQRVRAGVAYPGVLFAVGATDARVPNWQSVKLAARLRAASTSGRAVIVRVDDESGHEAGARDRLEAEWADLLAFARWQAGLADAR